MTGDGALDLEVRELGALSADSFAEPWDVRREAAAAEVVAKVSLWTYLREAGLLALSSNAPTPARWLSRSPSDKEAASRFAGVDQSGRDPCSSPTRIHLQF